MSKYHTLSCHAATEPKQLTQWKAHLNKVASRVDSRWVAEHESGSHQSAGMMKHKLVSAGVSPPVSPDSQVRDPHRIDSTI